MSDRKLLQLEDLKPHQCKWPIGDPAQPGFGFCGGRRAHGLPYCEAHASTAYHLQKKRSTVVAELTRLVRSRS
jgi:hypothetical protein